MAQPSPAQIKYMEEHRNDDRAPNIVICGSICLATAATAVVLRLMSRRLTGLKLGADDFLIVVSLVYLQYRSCNAELTSLFRGSILPSPHSYF